MPLVVKSIRDYRINTKKEAIKAVTRAVKVETPADPLLSESEVKVAVLPTSPTGSTAVQRYLPATSFFVELTITEKGGGGGVTPGATEPPEMAVPFAHVQLPVFLSLIHMPKSLLFRWKVTL
ncbi:hypothetical protein TYRP_017033 [Tyrophagus putrescentiae]|nr:hypothetical protein TYRP_017033 [Tyrophagus putrescentiae]